MDDWSEYEVKLIVSDYFLMLSKEISGISYKKSEHRKNILPLLNNRSEGSVEFKHQNISAVLINLGQPYIKGYLPRLNYQRILDDAVVEYLTQNIIIEEQFKYFAEKKVEPNQKIDFENLLIKAPKVRIVEESYQINKKNPLKINYLEREQSNNRLCFLGEELVLNFEKWYLIKVGKENLVEKIRWISKEEGDSAGFDILSKNINGSDKYIEVKTTKLGKETPFFFSRNELLFSQNHYNDYNLFRLINFDSDVKLFIKTGSLDTICNSVPVTFKGYF